MMATTFAQVAMSEIERDRDHHKGSANGPNLDELIDNRVKFTKSTIQGIDIDFEGDNIHNDLLQCPQGRAGVSNPLNKDRDVDLKWKIWEEGHFKAIIRRKSS